jgi:hypothetical protein
VLLLEIPRGDIAQRLIFNHDYGMAAVYTRGQNSVTPYESGSIPAGLGWPEIQVVDF